MSHVVGRGRYARETYPRKLVTDVGPIFPAAITDIWVSASGSDANSGLSPADPIQTNPRLQAMISGFEYRSALTVHYETDEFAAPVTRLDLDVVLSGPGTIHFVSTPQVAATGTLTAVTAIAPATQTRASVTDGSKPAGFFVPFADGLHWIVDTAAGPNLGATAAITQGSGSSATTGRPRSNVAPYPAAVFSPGDSYQVVRGSRLTLGDVQVWSLSTLGVDFTGFAFQSSELTYWDTTLGTVGDPHSASSVAVQCSATVWGGPLVPLAINCHFGNPSSSTASMVTAGPVGIDGGAWWAQALQDFARKVLLASDVWVGAFGAFVTPATFPGGLAVTAGVGAGAQFQDCSQSGIILHAMGNDFAGSLAGQGLMWGTGNSGFGLQLGAGAIAAVPSGGGNPSVPTVTGFAGDVGLLETGSTLNLAFAFNPVTGTYSGGLQVASWANFNGATFNTNMHQPASASSVVGVGAGLT